MADKENSTPRKKTRRKTVNPVGDPIEWTDAEIEKMAEVTDEGKAAARASWNRRAPRRQKNLLNARKRDGD